MKIKTLSALVAVLFLASSLVSVIPAMAKTTMWYVNEGESIQAVIDAAYPGDVIIVNAGIYDQTFSVEKPLTIRSNGATIDLLESSDPITAIQIYSSGVTISGFTIKIPANMISNAIFFHSGGSVVKDNIIYSGWTGIAAVGTFSEEVRIWNNVIIAGYPVFANCPNIEIKNNELSAFDTFPLVNPSFPSGNAIYLWGSISGGSIVFNQIDSTQSGILLQNPSNLQIKYNKIFSDSAAIDASGPSTNFVIANNMLKAENTGIRLLDMGMTDPVITGNVVCSDYWGIELHHVSEAKVNNNIVTIGENPVSVPGESLSLPGGILLWFGENCYISNNIVAGDFLSGIFLGSSSTNTIARNIVIGVYRSDPVTGDDAGIRLFPTTNGNTVKKNLILRVAQPIEDLGTDNIIIS